MLDSLAISQVPPWVESAPQVAFVVWFAYVGACIGSFLHVVYHRVPLGEDVVFQGSHCPECHAPIRWYHNLPIVGWLMLRGRCYDCQSPIPIRYWLFEVAFAIAFAVPGYFLAGWLF